MHRVEYYAINFIYLNILCQWVIIGVIVMLVILQKIYAYIIVYVV